MAASDGAAVPWWKTAANRNSGGSSSSKQKRKSISGGSTGSKQLCLDVGQKGFVRTTCPLCGMTWLPGDPNDEQLHRRHHASATDCLRFPGWSSEHCVWSSPGQGRVLLVAHTAPAQHLAKVQALCTFLESLLGLDPGWILRPLQPNTAAPPAATSPATTPAPSGQPAGGQVHRAGLLEASTLPAAHSVLLFVTAKKQVGSVLVVERLPPAVPVTRHADRNPATRKQGSQEALIGDGSEADGQPQLSSEGSALRASGVWRRVRQADSDSNPVQSGGWHTGQSSGAGAAEEQGEDAASSAGQENGVCARCVAEAQSPAVLGVRMVWVAPELRRQSVATRALNLARCALIPGYTVPTQQVAWARCTLTGEPAIQFARSWTGRQGRTQGHEALDDAVVLDRVSQGGRGLVVYEVA